MALLILSLWWLWFSPYICDSCQFPEAWTGLWFQKGVQDPIRIFNGTLSNKGICHYVDGDKFVLENRNERCYRCVVIHEKHENVLQYKETFCSSLNPLQTLETLCSEINGDALLYSMFRVNSPPVPCPFRGPFTFTYSREHGECRYPVSTIDSCTDDTHLLFRFQACADVMGSESRVEELVCLATWKEGSTRYLVGKLDHRMAKTDEDRFRCFVFEKNKRDANGYLVAQSGDATCDGLFSATEGSRTMKLTRTNHPMARCAFPHWLTNHRHWRTLDNRLTYKFDHRNNATYSVHNTSTGALRSKTVCVHEEYRTEQYWQVVVHTMSGCSNGYRCARVHRRANHVIEIQAGHLVAHAYDACQPFHFDPLTSEYTAIVTLSPAEAQCPLAGIFRSDRSPAMLRDPRDEPGCGLGSTLSLGCTEQDKIDLFVECPTEDDSKRFQCHGSWEENGTYYVITTAIGAHRRYCITFAENGKYLHVSGSSEICLRDSDSTQENFLAFNITSKGMCTDAVGHIVSPTSLLLLIFFLQVIR